MPQFWTNSNLEHIDMREKTALSQKICCNRLKRRRNLNGNRLKVPGLHRKSSKSGDKKVFSLIKDHCQESYTVTEHVLKLISQKHEIRVYEIIIFYKLLKAKLKIKRYSFLKLNLQA